MIALNLLEITLHLDKLILSKLPSISAIKCSNPGLDAMKSIFIIEKGKLDAGHHGQKPNKHGS